MSSPATLVIGAGMAGIMAARTLRAANRPVIVLEARARSGGRTYTDGSLGLPLDLGAAWIHGPDGNPLTALADELGVAYAPTDFINRTRMAVQAYGADGRLLDMEAYTRGQLLANGAYVHALASELAARPAAERVSLRDFLDHDLPRPAGLSGDAAQGFYYWSTVLAEYLSAADAETIDWRLGGQHRKLPGGDLLLYGGGFGALVERLVEGLDIRSGVIVDAITYGVDGVTVGTSQGEYRADHVIVTVPLGVLKAGAITFDPPLPEAKQWAIQRIGFGDYEKLALRFDHFYWPDDIQRFNYLSPGDPSLFNVWLNLGAYTGEPVIVAYHAGRRARAINAWDDDALVGAARDVLQHLFSAAGWGLIPAPQAYVRSGWSADPFSRGSYSFDRVGQRADDRRLLARPVAGRLFFAGEASHPHYYATVHGAYETGVRAAREVLVDLGRRGTL